jgi:hypothetical protein
MPALKTLGHLGTCPTPEQAIYPTFNTGHFGAEIAPRIMDANG